MSVNSALAMAFRLRRGSSGVAVTNPPGSGSPVSSLAKMTGSPSQAPRNEVASRRKQSATRSFKASRQWPPHSTEENLTPSPNRDGSRYCRFAGLTTRKYAPMGSRLFAARQGLIDESRSYRDDGGDQAS